MLATKVVCPYCSHHLKTSKPLTAGHRVLCSHCGRSFAVPPQLANGVAAETSARTPQPPTHPQPSPRQDAAHVQTAPNVGSLPAPARSRQTWLIGAVLGGLLLVMGATAGLALYFATRKDRQDEQAQASTTKTPDEEARIVDPPSPDDPLSPPPPRPADAPPPPDGSTPPPLRPSPPSPETPAPEPPSSAWLPPEEQAKVNKAIDQGVQFLEKTQKPGGGWGGRVGLVALPGLTLLECGVPASDTHIQKAVKRVRGAIPELNTTYDLALSILFLDRLRDPADKKLIETCALRLVSGQTPAGGWTYHCPLLKPDEARDLLTILQQTRPTSGLDLFVQGPNGSAPPGFVAQGSGAPLGKTTRESAVESKLLPEGATIPLEGDPAKKKPRDAAAVKKALARLPAELRELPALQPPTKSHNLPHRDVSDNSNTQFAILGLWAASRHGLPLERSLALVAQRFRKSEARKGGWSYHFAVPTPNAAVTPSMTGAGLLALAVGHGLAANHTSRPNGAGASKIPPSKRGSTSSARTSASRSAGRNGAPKTVRSLTCTSCGRRNASACCSIAARSAARTGIRGASNCSSTIRTATVPGWPVVIPALRPPRTPASPCCSSSAPISPRT